MTTTLRGISWNHSRALPPLVATSQRFEELHPRVSIQWERRSLHDFGHADIVALAKHYDLLVIDHPMLGDAHAADILVDLFPLLSPGELRELRDDTVGASFSSYIYQGRLYALPIDASAPAASYRPDLFKKHGLRYPRLWEDVIDLARKGWVRMPAFSADLFLTFLGLCVSHGSPTPASTTQFVDHKIGSDCLDQLAELAALMPDDIYHMNPISLYEQMATEDDIAYCPLAYTYSNYSREGFAAKRILFSNPVLLAPEQPIRSVLGGTGLAVSAVCKNPRAALEYGSFIASQLCQRTLYGLSGGQPARRGAWLDPTLNLLSDNFFSCTVDSVETAYVRPRFAGYVRLQEDGGDLLAAHCKSPLDTRTILKQLDELYSLNLGERSPHV